MTMDEVKAKILTNFEHHNSQMPGVTFGHILENVVPEDGEEVGDYPAKEFEGVVLWVGVTQKMITALNELVKDGILILTPCAPVMYLAGGGPIPNLPMASPRNYKNPHWAPAIFEQGPKYEKI